MGRNIGDFTEGQGRLPTTKLPKRGPITTIKDKIKGTYNGKKVDHSAVEWAEITGE